MTARSTALRYSADNGPVVMGLLAPIPLDIRWNVVSQVLIIEHRNDPSARIALDGETAQNVLIALAAARRRQDMWGVVLALLAPVEGVTAFDQARAGFYRCGNYIVQRPEA